MFGSIYFRHPEALVESLQDISDSYRESTVAAQGGRMLALQRAYVRAFGVPEIGFRLRGLYFSRALRRLRALRPRRVLDAGSGIGAYAIWLAKRYPDAEVTGWELDERKVRFSQEFARELGIPNLRFELRDLCARDTAADAYDLVVNVDVLEHIADYEAALANLHRLLRSEGHLFLHTPQPHQRRVFKRFDHWHHEDHVREGFTPPALVADLERLNYRVIEVAETFGLPGRLAWELNHMSLVRSPALAGAVFPMLYAGALIDPFVPKRHALATAIIAQKR